MKKQIIGFIEGRAIGSITGTVGQSQWWYERGKGPLGVVSSITEKVGGETLNAIFDGSAEECLSLFLERTMA